MHDSLNPTVKLLYLQGPFLLYTLSAKGCRRTISLQVYPFKLIINRRGVAGRVRSNSLLVDSGIFPPHLPQLPDIGSQEAGLRGLGMEGKIWMYTLPRGWHLWAIPMEANLKLKIRLSCPSKKAKHWPDTWKRLRQRDGKLRAEDMSKKVLNKRPEAELCLISWVSGPLRPQVHIANAPDHTEAGREGGLWRPQGKPGFWCLEKSKLSFF